MNLTDLGVRIRGLREKQGLTQSQVAHSVMLSAQAVSKWERGENAPDISVLVDLARLLGVSTDFLLTGEEKRPDTFEASIFCTSMRDFRGMTERLSPKEVSQLVNGIFQTLTEVVLAQGGVPVKYVGDGFLAFFSGAGDAERAIIAAKRAVAALTTQSLLISVDRGEIFLGAIGHSDYAAMDILGTPVNQSFLVNQWATESIDASIVMTEAVYRALPETLSDGYESSEILSFSPVFF